MILAALFLGALGLADLTRVRGGSRARHDDRPATVPTATRSTIVGAALGIAAFVLASVGSGLDWWWSPIAAAAIIGWLAATREDGTAGSRDRRAGYWALGALGAVIVAAFAWGPRLPMPRGPLVDWYDALPYGALVEISFTTFVLIVGATLFLVETSNVIVRLALRGERSAPTPALPQLQTQTPQPAPTPRWWRRTPTLATPESVAPPFVELKGGRFIGPLERIFLFALVLTGQFTAIAALVAAKGIIRFPEISKDTSGGSKAEYFLVGSFASWALVLVVSVLVFLGA